MRNTLSRRQLIKRLRVRTPRVGRASSVATRQRELMGHCMRAARSRCGVRLPAAGTTVRAMRMRSTVRWRHCCSSYTCLWYRVSTAAACVRAVHRCAPADGVRASLGHVRI